MSSTEQPASSETRKPRRRVKALIAATLAAAAIAVGVSLASSGGAVGADFTSSVQVNGSAKAGTEVAGVSGPLSFSNLIPGTPQTSTVDLTNAGTVPGKLVTIGAPVGVTGWTLPNAGNQPVDLSQVVVTVADSPIVNVPLTQLPTTIQLNSGIGAASDPNHPGTLKLSVTLEILNKSSAVNNPLMGASVAGWFTATFSTGV